IGNYCREAGLQVLVIPVPDLLDHLRATFDPQSPAAYDDTFEAVRTTYLLILDDLGAHISTPWAEEKLFQIINYRYNACLPTVITTSLTADAFDGKIASRLTDSSVSSVLPLKQFDFWKMRRDTTAAPKAAARRGRPPLRK
ncbi:MAG TPA: ATP-binding protein, partial [Dehalococcoidia bacterium]|nr:ATP-binding protein [Dehalococcoidia bacterium]